MFELMQYGPRTEKVYARPLVMASPQVNRFYAVDLAPEKSLIKWVVDSGVQLFGSIQNAYDFVRWIG